MSSCANVVPGEASESDTEDSLTKAQSSYSSTSLHAVTVPGEAPESDEEDTPPTPTSSSTSTRAPPVARKTKSFESLLHKKLFECNTSLRNNIVNLIKNTVNDSVSELSEVDQKLMKSQLRIQNASAALRSLENVSIQLNDRLNIAICTSYVPRITIPVIETDSD